MPLRQWREFPNSHHVKHVTMIHSPVYWTREIAAAAHAPGKELAKTMMVRQNGCLVMAVFPASCRVDFRKLREAFDAGNAGLASEEDFKDTFPGCERGAMPPFGNLHGIGVDVAGVLSTRGNIAFSAGFHTELVKLAYSDYEGPGQPKRAAFTVRQGSGHDEVQSL